MRRWQPLTRSGQIPTNPSAHTPTSCCNSCCPTLPLLRTCVYVLQTRNDVAADGLDLARRRIKKLEDQKEEAESRLQLAQVGVRGVGYSRQCWMPLPAAQAVVNSCAILQYCF